ncbi:MAG: hypothetical protein EHM36_04560 [Deltaproteobacteria bacterium]|nr:MAG: hypothetical protein EHM36_04560 [Deltaproteobacteria bacterium]
MRFAIFKIKSTFLTAVWPKVIRRPCFKEHPLVTEMKEKSGNGTAALNPWLIGENELKAELKKGDPSKPAEFVFGVSELEQGDIVSTTDQGKLFSIGLKNGDFSPNGKASAAKGFKSTLDFRRHLSEASQARESDILAYAEKIYTLFAKKDAEGILRESEVKINDYSKAFGGVDMKAELRRYLTVELFKSKLNKLNPAALRAVTVGPTNKIWHVFNGNDELITAKSSDGSMFELAVYIGLLDGKLKVVR